MVSHQKRFWFILFCFTFYSLQKVDGQEYNFIEYSLSEGLPQSQVFDALHDSKGYMWFGTQGGGLSRFDGQRFKNFTTKHGLPSNYVRTLFEDNLSRIWIGTKKGIALFDGKKIIEKPWEEQGQSEVVDFIQKNDSTLWLATRIGIWEYQYGTDTLVKKDIQSSINRVACNQLYKTSTGIWLASDQGGFFINKKGTVQAITEQHIQTIVEGKKGEIWLVGFDGKIEVISTHTLRKKYNLENANLRRAMCAFKESNGNIWIGSQAKGFSIFNPQDSTWTLVDERKGLAHNHVRAIVEDSWGNIWIATSGGGLSKYLGQFFIHFNQENGLHGERIYALCQDRKGQIWVSASNNGLAVYNGKGFIKSDLDSGYLNLKSKVIHQSKTGALWVGTEGGGLVKIDSTQRKIFTTEDGLPSNWVNSITEDTRGNIWVGTQTSGIAKLSKVDSVNYRIKVFSQSQGLPSSYINTLKKDLKNRIWFASRYGNLGYFQEGELGRVFGKEDGIPKVAIRSIVFDSLGNTYIGTEGEGIYKLDVDADKLEFKPIKFNQKLTSKNIYLLIFDRKNNLWVGSENGVDRIRFEADGQIKDLEHFGKNEGFLGIETCHNSTLCDRDGNLWFGTMNGLTRHSPSQKFQEAKAPIIHFKDIALFYKSLSSTDYKSWVNPSGGLKEGLEFPYRKNHLSFDFKALNLSDPQSIRYRWMLEGAETEWSPFSERESVNYSNLKPGEYSFLVQAKSEDQLFSNTLKASFEIQKPFWQLLWVQLLALGSLLLFIYLIVKNRIRQLRKKEAQKREKLEIKNRVLELEQKALQLQMNPHFIFNALNSIQSLVTTKDYQGARSEIGNFATLMRSILSNSRKERISLKEEIDTLHQYLEMEQFCQRVAFDFEINAPREVDAEEIEIPPMLLQPFVENAVIHGISHLQDRKGKIEIKFEVQGEKLQCIIMDNGVGKKKAEELKQSKKPGHQSVAMAVNKERLEALKGKENYVPLQFEDRLQDQTEVVGTIVTIQLPLEINY